MMGFDFLDLCQLRARDICEEALNRSTRRWMPCNACGTPALCYFLSSCQFNVLYPYAGRRQQYLASTIICDRCYGSKPVSFTQKAHVSLLCAKPRRSYKFCMEGDRGDTLLEAKEGKKWSCSSVW